MSFQTWADEQTRLRELKRDAAPELYASLLEFMAIWDSGDSNSTSKRAQKRRAEMWDKANAAVAKARGEQHA